jgi:hypothetical protein
MIGFRRRRFGDLRMRLAMVDFLEGNRFYGCREMGGCGHAIRESEAEEGTPHVEVLRNSSRTRHYRRLIMRA